jgi:hypothetical protein
VLRRAVNELVVVFWISAPLLGMAAIVPWLRIGWLLDVLAVPTMASAAVLMVLTLAPGYVSPISSVVGERVVYALAWTFAVYTIALNR